jgi:hypothetical protein
MSSDAPEFVLTEANLKWVERFGEYSSKQEALDYFGLAYSELLPQDKENFDFAFKKGRCNARDFAFTKLKEACTGKMGMQSSLAILTQFGSQWTKADGASGVKSFRISLGEED